MSASSKPHPGGSNSIVVSRAVFLKSEDIVRAFFIKSEGLVGPCQQLTPRPQRGDNNRTYIVLYIDVK